MNEPQRGQPTMDADSSPAPAPMDSVWRMHRAGFDPTQAALEETLFALSNGSLGVRAGFEEAVGPTDGTFLAGVHARSPIHYHERLAGFARNSDTRVPVAEGKGIAVLVDGERLVVDAASVLACERELDLRGGRLRRRMRVRSARGTTFEIRAERIVPLGWPDVLAIRFVLRSIDHDGNVMLLSSLETARPAQSQGDDPRIGAGNAERLHCLAAQVDGDTGWIHEARRDGDLHVIAAQRHAPGPGLQPAGDECGDGRVAQRFAAEIRPGREIVLEKFVAYASGPRVEGLRTRTGDALQRACAEGVPGIGAIQAAAMAAFWMDADVAVPGDPAVERALRFNLFHIFQSAGRNGIDGTAAKGMTGEGYEGHCFWDTEAFVLPAMVLLAPDVARAMLSFRHRTLDAARAHAREMNHPRGALYPWRTIAGDECSAHYPSGSAAYHINAAVAYAIGLYLDATDDAGFLQDAGAEMLFETARIWPQAGHFNPRRGGAFCIHEVTGPDEYTTLVDNNHYTNRMARQHLRLAVAVWHRLRADAPDALSALSARIGLDDGEVALWARAAGAMYLGYDARAGVFAQDDGFLDKPRWPFPPKPGGHRPLLLDYHPLTLYRHQICKQADVTMALVLAGDDVDAACKKRCFDYYEAVTTHDSTLSAPVHAILAAEVGHADKALGYFLDSLRVDLDDLHGNTAHGAHMAAMAGSWLALAQGFAGLRVHEGTPGFAPSLPPGWPGYGLGLRWRGRRLRVDVTDAGVVYRLHEGEPLTIHHEGQPVELRCDAPVSRALSNRGSAARASFPRRCEALIFDLDGVLTDTAETHYRAWRRLADEIGVPFARADNERMKGVDRMASLDILLERASRDYPPAERLALAARKNEYYVQEISDITPDRLFDGVHALLADARRRGLKLAIASASRNAALLLRNLGIADKFDHVVDAAQLSRAKPDPEIFLAAAHALGVSPAACIGIEDSLAGIAAIHAAGMSAIGVGDAGVLSPADAVVSDIARLRLSDFVIP